MSSLGRMIGVGLLCGGGAFCIAGGSYALVDDLLIMNASRNAVYSHDKVENRYVNQDLIRDAERTANQALDSSLLLRGLASIACGGVLLGLAYGVTKKERL